MSVKVQTDNDEADEINHTVDYKDIMRSIELYK